ncbi:hypothetical protein [Spiroplasma endosymbiont of Labia minor]|uniref:hypothetical protein n=1 Tax=Spiroplasma endosymbiont of Labia minor TaxID=3066305 RepID=UPI0030D46432
MTKYSLEQVDNYLNNLPETVANEIVDEVMINIDMAFGMQLFEPAVEEIVSQMKGVDIAEIIKEAQSIEFSDEEILAELENRLGTEESAKYFADDAVDSVLFNVEGTVEFKHFIELNSIDEPEFFKTLIVLLIDEFIESFKSEENNIKEWKHDVIADIVELLTNEEK